MQTSTAISGQTQSISSNTANFDKKNFNTNDKPKDVRRSNIIAAKGNFNFN